MGLGGLFARLALLKEQMKKTPCERCGLHYDRSKKEECPHCDTMDHKGLEHFLEQKNTEKQGNKSLGFVFAVIAIVLLFFVVAISGG